MMTMIMMNVFLVSQCRAGGELGKANRLGCSHNPAMPDADADCHADADADADADCHADDDAHEYGGQNHGEDSIVLGA